MFGKVEKFSVIQFIVERITIYSVKESSISTVSQNYPKACKREKHSSYRMVERALNQQPVAIIPGQLPIHLDILMLFMVYDIDQCVYSMFQHSPVSLQRFYHCLLMSRRAAENLEADLPAQLLLRSIARV